MTKTAPPATSNGKAATKPATENLTRESLIKVFSTALPATKRTSIPILSMVRMTAAKGTLTVTATDLDLAITTSIPAPGDYDIVAPVRLLLRFLRACGSGA